MFSPKSGRLSLFAALLILGVATVCCADFSQAVKTVDPAIVTITTSIGEGSGFFVSLDGHILTNHHVVKDASGDITVKLQNGETLKASVQNISPERDLAILKTTRGNLPIVQFASSENIELGQNVAAIGAPLGLEHSVTTGVVSSISREIEDQTYIQIDAALNQGNSGGPVINDQGQVVGVAVMVAAAAQNVGFAIPSVDVMRFLQANDVSFNAALGHAPAASEATDADAATADAPQKETVPAEVPTDSAPPGAPQPSQMPITWLLWPALVSFFIALLTSLIVSLLVTRSRPAAAPAQAQQIPQVPVTIQAPPAVEEDLSDIDIDLH